MSVVTLIPAYGRDFKTAKQAEANFGSGLDWVVASIHTYIGSYCSIRDFTNGVSIKLRFNKNRKCVVLPPARISMLFQKNAKPEPVTEPLSNMEQLEVDLARVGSVLSVGAVVKSRAQAEGEYGACAVCNSPYCECPR